MIFLEWSKTDIKNDLFKIAELIESNNHMAASEHLKKMMSVFKAIREPSLVELMGEIRKTYSHLINTKNINIDYISATLINVAETLDFLVCHPEIKSSFYSMECNELKNIRGSHKAKVGYFKLLDSNIEAIRELNSDVELNNEIEGREKILDYAYKMLMESYDALNKGENESALKNVFKIVVGVKKIASTRLELTFYQLITSVLRTIDKSDFNSNSYIGIISKLANIVLSKKDNNDPVGISDFNHALSVTLFYSKTDEGLIKFLKRIGAYDRFKEAQEAAKTGSLLSFTRKGVLIDQIEAELKLIAITSKNGKEIKSRFGRVVSALEIGGYEVEADKIRSVITNASDEDIIETILRIVQSYNLKADTIITGGVITDKKTLDDVKTELLKEFGAIKVRYKIGSHNFETIYKHLHKIKLTFTFLKMSIPEGIGTTLLKSASKCDYANTTDSLTFLKAVIAFESVATYMLTGCTPSSQFLSYINECEKLFSEREDINAPINLENDDSDNELNVTLRSDENDYQKLLNALDACDVIIGRTNEPNTKLIELKAELSNLEFDSPDEFELNAEQLNLIDLIFEQDSLPSQNRLDSQDNIVEPIAISPNPLEDFTGKLLPMPVENIKLFEIASKEFNSRLATLNQELLKCRLTEESHRAIHSIRGILRNLGYSDVADHPVLSDLESRQLNTNSEKINENESELYVATLYCLSELIQRKISSEDCIEKFKKKNLLINQSKIVQHVIVPDDKENISLVNSETMNDTNFDALSYLEESNPIIKNIKDLRSDLESNSITSESINELCRLVHTLKGAANMLGLSSLGKSIHLYEDFLELIKHGVIGIDKITISSIKSGIEFLVSVNNLISSSSPIIIDSLAFKYTKEAISDSTNDIEFNLLMAASQLSDTDAENVMIEPDAVIERLTRSRTKNSISSFISKNETIQIPVSEVQKLVSLTGSNKSSRIKQLSAQTKNQSDKIKTGINTIVTHIEELKSIVRLNTTSSVNAYSSEDLAVYSDIEDLISRIENMSANISGYTENILDISNSFMNSSENIQSNFDNARKIIFDSSQVNFGSIEEKLSSMILDVCKKTNKQVGLKIIGSDEKIEKTLLLELTPALQHMMRNSVDHGIESLGKRKELGKPNNGVIEISAKISNNVLSIKFSDDGAGIDPDTIYEKAKHKGLISKPIESVSEKFNLILMPGFSTRDNATDISGRGVGMDVVGDFIKSKGGSIQIESVIDQGTTFKIQIPLAAQSSSVFVCGYNSELIGLPRSSLAGHAILERDQDFITFNGQNVPVIPLHKLIGRSHINNEYTDSLKALIINNNGSLFAVSFELSFGMNDVYIKALPGEVTGIVGVTDFNDGSVISVINPSDLFHKHIEHNGMGYQLVPKYIKKQLTKPIASALVVDDSPLMRNEISKMLADSNFETISATDGADAISLIDSSIYKFDLITLDIEMPNIDGLTLLKRIKSTARTSNIPVIIVSSRASEKYQGLAFKYGAADFLTKPISRNQLNDSVNTVLAKMEVRE